MRVTVRAFDEHGYERDILIFDNVQVRMQDSRVEFSSIDGIVIDPEKFPEMKRFSLIIDRDS